MERLGARDVSAVMSFASELRDLDDVLAFSPRVMGMLQTIVPGNEVAYCELDRSRKKQRFLCWTNGEQNEVIAGSEDEDLSAYWNLVHTHPVCGYRTRTGDWIIPRKASDFVSLREFRRTPIYDALYRGKLDYWFDFGLPPERSVTRMFLFVRSDRDFSERDRLVARVVQPHLEKRAAEIRATTGAAAALVAAEGGSESGVRLVVLCATSGVIEFAAPAARALMKRYMGIDNGRLPPGILMQSHLVLEDGEGRLTIHVARTGGLRILFLEERDKRVDRLTPREREILDRVAAGRTNAEIAFDLEIAIGTVAKHLEHVYEKLGVRSRTAAAAVLAGESRPQPDSRRLAPI